MSSQTQAQKVSGFSYTEVLIATILVSISIAPALESLQHNLFVFSEAKDVNNLTYSLTASMEETLAKDFETLLSSAGTVNSRTVPSTLSDSDDSEDRRLVYLGFHDLENADGDHNPLTIQDSNNDSDNNPYTGSGANIDTIWIKVEIENTAYHLTSLSTQL